MASITGSSSIARPQPLLHTSSRATHHSMKPSVSFLRTGSTKFNTMPLHFRISCAAKADTVEKVSDIVKKQLALKDEQQITGETKFSDLGADSLDTVEIVMRLEEEFGVSVEEENAQAITTIGDAAELIEKLQQ